MNESLARAEELIRATGDRVTGARVQVLNALLAAGRALTHSEIEERVDPALGVNRVTVYRILDWLTRRHLAHRIAGDDRVWRFNAADAEHGEQHAHFKCTACGRIFCLDELGVAAPNLPVGFRLHELELTVKGHCDACDEHQRRQTRGGARASARK